MSAHSTARSPGLELAASAASVPGLQTLRQMRRAYTSHARCEVVMRVSPDALAGLLRRSPPLAASPPLITSGTRACCFRLWQQRHAHLP